MLVLSRKQGERICIGDDIEISVVAVQGNRVKLAFTAPRNVSIQRRELLAATVSLPLAKGDLETRTERKIPR